MRNTEWEVRRRRKRTEEVWQEKGEMVGTDERPYGSFDIMRERLSWMSLKYTLRYLKRVQPYGNDMLFTFRVTRNAMTQEK